MGNVTNLGKDENGNWVAMGATTDSSGNDAGRVVVSDTVTTSESSPSMSLYYKNTFSGTATALGTTTNLNYLGLPFDTLTVTASGAVNQVDVHFHLTANGGVLYIEALNGDTVSITAATGTETFSPSFSTAAGVVGAGTALAATGTYYLYLG